MKSYVSSVKLARMSHQKVHLNSNYNFLLYKPPSYENNANEFPLIMFLHGAGEKGKDITKIKVHGIPRIVEELIARNEEFPFITVSPQCPTGSCWETEPLKRLLDEVIASHRVDTGKMYLTGISMGGFGTWNFAFDYPHLFAAILPICGGGDAKRATSIKHLPVWNFHGAKDYIVSINYSDQIVDALKKIGGNVKYTIYPEAGHDSWTETYNNSEIYQWFLEQLLPEESQ